LPSIIVARTIALQDRIIHPARVRRHDERRRHGIGVIFPAQGIAKGLEIANIVIILKIRKRHIVDGRGWSLKG
jgi:hypothetical protein